MYFMSLSCSSSDNDLTMTGISDDFVLLMMSRSDIKVVFCKANADEPERIVHYIRRGRLTFASEFASPYGGSDRIKASAPLESLL